MIARMSLQKRLIVFLMLATMCLSFVPGVMTAASAEEKGRWEAAADEIDAYLDSAFEYYLEGDATSAYNAVNNAYFKTYEVTGFERQTMSYISGPRKNSIELQFSTCKGAVKKDNQDPETQTAVRTELNKLKSMIREDANKLAVKDGEAGSTTKYYDHGTEVATDPYAKYAGDPNAKTQYKTWVEAYEAIAELLDTANTAFKGKDAEAAADNINTAYYSVYEESLFDHQIYVDLTIEDRTAADEAFEALLELATNGKNQKTAFANQCKKVKNLLKADAEAMDAIAAEAAAQAAAEAAEAAAQAAAADGATASTGSVIFLGAFGIIVREGLEAILVIAAIIAYLVKAGQSKYLRSVYVGSVLGIVCSFLAAYALTLVKRAVGDAYGAQAQEIMEGCTALVAVCVLFYVSNWMISKAEAEAWTTYIDDKVQSSVQTGSSKALAFAAFLSVFREGAEVVLFYQPMLVEDGNPAMVWAGFGVGCVVLVFVFIAIRYLSVRLPLKPFFTVTSIFMAVMCVSFFGSAIKEFAEGGLFDVTQIPWMWTENDITDALGLYPFAEPIMAQLLLTIAVVSTFIIGHYKNKEIAAAKKAAKA